MSRHHTCWHLTVWWHGSHTGMVHRLLLLLRHHHLGLSARWQPGCYGAMGHVRCWGQARVLRVGWHTGHTRWEVRRPLSATNVHLLHPGVHARTHVRGHGAMLVVVWRHWLTMGTHYSWRALSLYSHHDSHGLLLCGCAADNCVGHSTMLHGVPWPHTRLHRVSRPHHHLATWGWGSVGLGHRSQLGHGCLCGGQTWVRGTCGSCLGQDGHSAWGDRYRSVRA